MKKEMLAELERIKSRKGTFLRPKDVLAEAEKKDNPLHPYFDWDDTEAARKWRLEQARELIQLAVTIIPNTNKPSRVYVSLWQDRNKKHGGYRSMVEVMTDAQLRRQYLYEALEELKRFQERYKDLEQLAQVFAAIKKVKVRKAG